MIECPICHKEFVSLTMLHIRIHGYSKLEDFKKDYPDQKFGDSRGHEWKRKRAGRPTKREEDKANVLLGFHDGEKVVGLKFPRSEFKWFVRFKEEYNWDSRTALRALLTLWYENSDSEIVKTLTSRIRGGEKLSDITINPMKHHFDKLEELMRDLEEKIKLEQDPNKQAQEIKSLAEVNKTRAELEKLYKSASDDRIQNLVENQKLICKNYLPKLLESWEVGEEENGGAEEEILE